MSIESTKMSMGYIGFTDSPSNCGACGQSRVEAAKPGLSPNTSTRAGLRCGYGGFWTMRRATCKRFDQVDPAPTAGRLQVGPTDI